MKALRWHAREDIRIDEIPPPDPGPDEVLLQVMYSGICGSELHEFLAGPIFIPIDPHPLTGTNAPQTMGHEYGGRVVAVGSNVTDLSTGTIVAVNPILACNVCPSCRRGTKNLCDQLAYYGLIGDGGHAEYSVVKAANCIPIPPEIPPEYAAFAEPAGTAYHAINQAGNIQGASVAVLGGGTIGQLAVQYAKAAGARQVILTEPIDNRIDIAKSIGAADVILNPLKENIQERIFELTDGQGVDFSIECCGGAKTGMLEDTAYEAVAITRAEGKTVIVGTFAAPTEFHFNSIVLMERNIVGSFVWHNDREYREAIQLIVDGKIAIAPLISGKVRIEDALEKGIQILSLEKESHLKILIDFT